jgi:hypothetical protein
MHLPRKIIIVCVGIALIMCGGYVLSWWHVFGLMRTANIEKVIVEEGVKTSTLRTQEKIEALFIKEDDVARMFSVLEESVQDGVSLVIDSVSNAQPALKIKASPVTFIDAKITLKGPWDGVVSAVKRVESLPYVVRVIEVEVFEDADAQAPGMRATVRFFFTKPLIRSESKTIR